MIHEAFWQTLAEFVRSSRIVIDRPRGSLHPRYPEFRYPLDYGYLEGTCSGDGQGIDVWIGSDPARQITGVIVTADAKKYDAEIKILLGCTPAEQQEILTFVNQGSQAGLLVERPQTPSLA
ncbi:MAG TPA: inorganic pyrophosphatase [Ktedonobacteraceae bacterium]|jgi:inorganic pyrophosphatase|nr:inorganic pyrophosphatase [Ktedonobacteraceae bacterium]